jgi:DNA-binding IclR family transcriptional regulator
VDLLSVIRRWHGRDKLPIREIARRTGLSRNTIRKYLANRLVHVDLLILDELGYLPFS